MVYLSSGILHSCKEGTLTLCDSMNGPGDYYTKLSKSIKERQISNDLTFFVESNEQNKLINKIETKAWIFGTD